jgi:hypothetical protein
MKQPGRTGRGVSTNYSDFTADITCIHDHGHAEKVFRIEAFEGEPPLPQIDERSWHILDTVIETFHREKVHLRSSGGEIGIVLRAAWKRAMITLMEDPALIGKAVQFYATCSNGRRQWIHSRPMPYSGDMISPTRPAPLSVPPCFAIFILTQQGAGPPHQIHLWSKDHETLCGNVWRLLDYLSRSAMTPINPFNPPRIWNWPGETALRRQDHPVGGVAVEHLISGTPEEVRRDVRSAMACAKMGGAFILGAAIPSL